jgi:hypothetical protein
MKNQGIMMTHSQRFLATLDRVASRRMLHHSFANKLADDQVIVLTWVSFPHMIIQ